MERKIFARPYSLNHFGELCMILLYYVTCLAQYTFVLVDLDFDQKLVFIYLWCWRIPVNVRLCRALLILGINEYLLNRHWSMHVYIDHSRTISGDGNGIEILNNLVSIERVYYGRFLR